MYISSVEELTKLIQDELGTQYKSGRAGDIVGDEGRHEMLCNVLKVLKMCEAMARPEQNPRPSLCGAHS